MKKTLAILLIWYSLPSFGQDAVFRKYDLEKLSIENNFFTLTKRENRIDSLGEESHRSLIKSIKNGTAFLKKQTNEEIEKSIEIENLTYLRFKDNRGRFNIYAYSNQTKDTTSRNQMWSKTMCYLGKDNTIEILTGNGIFGSESITIRLNKDQYYSTYSLDAQQKMFKRYTSDSISTNQIDVANIESSLKLSKELTFQPGEQLVGSLTFKTESFLRDSEYNTPLYHDEGTGTLYNQIYIAGTVMFTCKTQDVEVIKQLSNH